MRREYFGSLGGLLNDQELARAILLAAEEPQSLRQFLTGALPFEKLSAKFVEQSPQVARVREGTEPLDLDMLRIRRTLRTADGGEAGLLTLRKRLPELWAARSRRNNRPEELTLSRFGTDVDLQWLAQVLIAEPTITSVLFKSSGTSSAPWNWPLKIGVPESELGRKLAQEFSIARYKEVYETLIVGVETNSVDLLLFPESLASADLQRTAGPVSAGAVVAIGSGEIRSDEATTRLRALRRRYTSGLAAICFVPPEECVAWFMTAIRELSHNVSLARSIFAARLGIARTREGGTDEDLRAPILIGESHFVRGSTVGESARRLGVALQAHPLSREIQIGATSTDNLFSLGVALEKGLSNFHWLPESGDAASIVRLRRGVEIALGPLGLERAPPEQVSNQQSSRGREFYDTASSYDISGAADASEKALPPPLWSQPRGPELRHVQAKLLALGMARSDAPVKKLDSAGVYRIRIHIGVRKDADALVIADEPINLTSLPASPGGHDIRIVFCPLTRVLDGDGNEYLPQPLQATVHLPIVGESTRAEFVFDTGANARRFRARVVVTHANYVLQTLILHTRSGKEELSLDTENVYSREFRANTDLCDIAFVVNDNREGIAGITTLVGDSTSFVEPLGVQQSIATIRELLSESNVEAVGAQSDLSSPKTLSLLITLAQHGVAILRELWRLHPLAKFGSAMRVQVVEAVDKAYLPVEFFYQGKAPDPDAVLCPKAIAALGDESGNVHADCSYRMDPGYVCPAAFWGFHKCIERHPSTGSPAHVFSSPELGNSRLGPFKRALLAASERAASEMIGTNGLPAIVAKVIDEVGEAVSWKDWKAQIAATSPGLLLLLPHSDESPDVPGMPALEVSGYWLTSASLDNDYVNTDETSGKGPLVLLFGCATALAEIPFLNFARLFSCSGASLVLGTLAVIHSSQASMLAQRLLDEMKRNEAAGGVRFDEALLRIKRELLASGNGLALSLVGYGHSSWRI